LINTFGLLSTILVVLTKRGFSKFLSGLLQYPSDRARKVFNESATDMDS